MMTEEKLSRSASNEVLKTKVNVALDQITTQIRIIQKLLDENRCSNEEEGPGT